MTTTAQERRELLEMASAATPRPWYPQHSDDRMCMNTYYVATEDVEDDPLEIHGKVIAVTLYQSERCACHDAGRWEEDAAYIAAACNLAPALAREVEELLSQLAAERQRADKAEDERDVLAAELADLHETPMLVDGAPEGSHTTNFWLDWAAAEAEKG